MSNARQKLDGKYAEQQRLGISAFDGDRELVRYWPDIEPGEVEGMLDLLKTYTDAKNGTAKSTVAKPKSNREEIDGTWRHVTCWAETTKNVSVVFQTLRLGLATSLSDESPRLRDFGHTYTTPHKNAAVVTTRLVRAWENLDPTKVKDLEAGVKSGTVTGPTASGEAYPGVYTVASARGYRAEDGSGIVEQTLEIVSPTITYTGSTPNESQWILSRYRAQALIPEKTLVRLLIGVSPAKAKVYVDALYDITSRNNPKANNTAYSGLFRNADVVSDEDSNGLVTITQTLILGWATTALPTAIRVEDRDVRKTPFDAADIVITRDQVWWYKGIDPAKADDLKPTTGEVTGQSYRIIEVTGKKEGDGSYSIYERRRTQVIADQTVQTGKGFQVREQFPNVKAKGISLTVYDIADDKLELAKAELRGNPDGYVVDSLTIEHSRDNTNNLRQELKAVVPFPETIPDAEGTSWIRAATSNVLSQAEAIEIVFHDVAAAELAAGAVSLKATPAIAGYKVVDVRNNDSGKPFGDLVQRLRLIGTTNITRRIEWTGSDAETQTILLPSRDGLPTYNAPTGYYIASYDVNGGDQPLQDYVYQLVKIGTGTPDSQREWIGNDAESFVRVYPNRSADPGTPEVAGFFLLRKEKVNPDRPVSDYRYAYQRVGTVAILGAVQYPGQPTEVLQVDYPRQTADPSVGPAGHFVDYAAGGAYILTHKGSNDSGRGIADWQFRYFAVNAAGIITSVQSPGEPGEQVTIVYRVNTGVPIEDLTDIDGMEAEGYALVGKANTGSGRGFEDWTLKWVKISEDGTLVRTGVVPGFFKREIREIMGIRDTALDAKLTELETDTDPLIMVVSVKSTYRGAGFGNVMQTILYLPAAETVETRDFVERTTRWLHPLALNVFNRQISYINASGNPATTTGFSTSIQSYRYVGNGVRKIVQTVTTTYTKGKPTKADPSGDFFDYTYEKVERDRGVGYWVKQSIRTVIGNGTDEDWVTSL